MVSVRYNFGFLGALMIKHIANAITGCRIIGSVLLLLFPAFSAEFYIIYIICGFSDMIDGPVARRTNSTSEFGAKIDTASDLVFVTAALIKVMPTLDIPLWIWLWFAVIAIIKIGNIIWGFALRKQFIALHTVLNKVTGALMFLLPLTLPLVELRYTSVAVCSVATFAAIQEWIYIARDREIQ